MTRWFTERCSQVLKQNDSVLWITHCQDEATVGRQRLSESPDNLRVQYRNDRAIQQPYSYNHIAEAALRLEISRIWHGMAAELQPFYARGYCFAGQTDENWVIRWCLYHSFRYTDKRNPTRTRKLSSTGNVPNGLAGGLYNDQVVSFRCHAQYVA